MTYETSACPCCGSPSLTSRPAVIAPFIARYVLDGQPRPTAIHRCDDCDVLFFGTRYSDLEIAQLYRDYRGERYLSIRHHFEPWYTRHFNASIGGPAGISPRQAVYREMLAAITDTPIESVLDYAGDSGQMMVGGPGRDLFVFDISGAPPVDGITGVADEKALAGRLFDLVLLCGIVEHFSEPFEQIKQVGHYVKPGGLLYVEVPAEHFVLEQIPGTRWYETYLRWLLHTRIGFLLADFWSTGFRVKFNRIPPLGFVKFHEHQNYFNAKAMSALVRRAGFDLLECRTTDGSVVALCRRPAA